MKIFFFIPYFLAIVNSFSQASSRNITHNQNALNKKSFDTTQLNLMSFHQNGINNIPKYSKFEIGVQLPSYIQNQINSFLSSGNGINPYNPEELKVVCTIKHQQSNRSFIRNAFYYLDYIVQNNIWMEQYTDYKYRVRFSPPLVGDYNCRVSIYLNGTLTIYDSLISFKCVASENRGHLNITNSDLRRLQFENGDMFFGVGECIAFADQAFGQNNPNFPNLYYPNAMYPSDQPRLI